MADLEVQTIAQRRAAKRNLANSYVTEEVRPPVVPFENSELEEPIQSHQSNFMGNIDRNQLLAMAKSMGLELRPEKKVWIKHSYSVTQESKEKFSNYCDTLGRKMQDALDEAFNDWFKKNKSEFEAITKREEISQFIS